MAADTGDDPNVEKFFVFSSAARRRRASLVPAFFALRLLAGGGYAKILMDCALPSLSQQRLYLSTLYCSACLIGSSINPSQQSV